MTRTEAQKRNFAKYRLSGIQLPDNFLLTNEELITINIIKDTIKKLLDKWDNNSKVFVSSNSSIYKKYKCYCGKTTNVSRQILSNNTEIFVCKKHFEQMKKDFPDRIVENKNK